MSSECQQLNRLFSQCVDGNRIKVPPQLEDPPEPSEGALPLILDILHEAATMTINGRVDDDKSLVDYSTHVLDIIASRDRAAVSEFELIQMVLHHCDRHHENFADYAQYFNYSALSDEQQAWLLMKLPSPKSNGTVSMVTNGLWQSHLVVPAELQRFRLDHPALHWKPIFTSGSDRMGRFLSSASRSLELFHKKLIILRADERLTLMIYIPQKISTASETQVNGSVRVFALPRSSGFDSAQYQVKPTKVNSRVYCDESVFQLYETVKKNTFIFLTRGPLNQASFHDTKNEGDRRRDIQQSVEDGTNFETRASVALDKISGPIQKHVGRLNRAGVLAAVRYHPPGEILLKLTSLGNIRDQQ